MSTLKVGDKVRYIGMTPELRGQVGTVVFLNADSDIGVDFEHLTISHDCNGHARKGHGWWTSHDALVPITGCNYDDY